MKKYIWVLILLGIEIFGMEAKAIVTSADCQTLNANKIPNSKVAGQHGGSCNVCLGSIGQPTPNPSCNT